MLVSQNFEEENNVFISRKNVESELGVRVWWNPYLSKIIYNMTGSLKKFKEKLGDEYDRKIKEYADSQDIAGAVTQCKTCNKLALFHDPGPCSRSKAEQEELEDIELMKNGILNEIMVEKMRGESKGKETDVVESLVEALKKVVNVKPAQITKTKKPPVWNKETFEDFKIEVEAWDNSHNGDEYVKYDELMEKLKENKNIKGLAEFACTVLIQRTREKKNVKEVLKILEEKYALTRREKFEQIIEKIKRFQDSSEKKGLELWENFHKIEAMCEKMEVEKNFKYFLAILFSKKVYESEVITKNEKRCIQEKIENEKEENIINVLRKEFKSIKIEFKRDGYNTTGSV